MAFENSVCRHYVTEKFWYPFRRLAVPVVLSRAALQGLNIPSDSFIGADDFANAQDLAKYLIEMSKNEKEYLRYLKIFCEYSIPLIECLGRIFLIAYRPFY